MFSENTFCSLQAQRSRLRGNELRWQRSVAISSFNDVNSSFYCNREISFGAQQHQRFIFINWNKNLSQFQTPLEQWNWSKNDFFPRSQRFLFDPIGNNSPSVISNDFCFCRVKQALYSFACCLITMEIEILRASFRWMRNRIKRVKSKLTK